MTVYHATPPPPNTYRPEWSQIKLQLRTFGDREPTPIAASEITARVRYMAWRINRKADRMQRVWERKHGGLDRETAVHFSFWHLTDLSPLRRGDVYRFINFGMGGRPPRGKTLSDWVTAYTLVDPATETWNDWALQAGVRTA